MNNDERLISQLFFDIVHFNRNINMGMYFANKFGYEYIQRLPPQTQIFYDQNAAILQDKYIENLKWPAAKLDDFYHPEDLADQNIVFVDDIKKIDDMLDFFETTKPDIIGIFQNFYLQIEVKIRF